MKKILLYRALLIVIYVCFVFHAYAGAPTLIEVGTACVDISPQTPIRLAGFGVRVKAEATNILQRLNAKAIAIGSDKEGPAIIITVDLIGIPWSITNEVATRLKKVGIAPEGLAICASHTHSGPEVGTLINILQYRTNEVFSDSLLPVKELEHISKYIRQLPDQLEQVALAALNNRKPSVLSWGIGKVDFAYNRRAVGGPVDHDMPLMKITDPKGNLKAVFLNYACHAVAMGGATNEVHGDWVGEAQQLIERAHPGVTALIAVGCGADANPYRDAYSKTRSALDFTKSCGQKIAAETNRLLSTSLRPVSSVPNCSMKKIELPYSSIPDTKTLIQQTKEGTVKAYYSRLALEQIARGNPVPSALKDFPIQSWTFGKDLVMIFYGGETLSAYSLRLKRELGTDKLWINGYSNDVSCYIASEDALRDPRFIYETTHSMYYYHKPAPFASGVEDKIISTVYELLPSFLKDHRK